MPRTLPLATPVRRDRAVFVEDAWYAIALARDLRGSRPLGVRRFGRELALFRGADGRVAAVNAACPHRGADLARGRVIHGSLQCPYHGFRFAADGRCVDVPCEGAGYRVPEGLAAKAYPVREAHGWIWLWWGAPREHYPEIPWTAELPDGPTSRTADVSVTWDCSLPLSVESNLDLHHVPFAHRRVSPGVGTRLDPYVAELAGDVVRSRGTLRKDDGAAWDGRSGWTLDLECHFPSLLFAAFGRIRVAIALAPIDETNTWLAARYFYDWPLIGGLIALISARLEFLLVQPDDLAQQRAAARSGMAVHECRFVPSDRAIVLWYGLYRRRIARAEEQLEPGTRPGR